MKALPPQKHMVKGQLVQEVGFILGVIAAIEENVPAKWIASFTLANLQESMISFMQSSGHPATHLVLGNKAVNVLSNYEWVLQYIEGATYSVEEVSAGYLGKILGMSIVADAKPRGKETLDDYTVWVGNPQYAEHGTLFNIVEDAETNDTQVRVGQEKRQPNVLLGRLISNAFSTVRGYR